MLNFSARFRAFTLVELLIVISIIGITVVPLILTYRYYRTSQALSASAESIANQAKSAHIFSREARGQREWGIKYKNERVYVLYSTGVSGVVEEQAYFLENGVSFEDSFDILFKIGTGTSDADSVVKLINTNGKKTWIEVGRNGVVEIVVDP